jgi:hypothetical protein
MKATPAVISPLRTVFNRFEVEDVRNGMRCLETKFVAPSLELVINIPPSDDAAVMPPWVLPLSDVVSVKTSEMNVTLDLVEGMKHDPMASFLFS